MTHIAKLKLFECIIGLIGYGILFYHHWSIALAVFLIHWSINAHILIQKGKGPTCPK